MAQFSPARFHEPDLQDLCARVSHEGGSQLLKGVDEPSETIRVMGRTSGTPNIASLSPELFMPGARRIQLNMDKGGIQGSSRQNKPLVIPDRTIQGRRTLCLTKIRKDEPGLGSRQGPFWLVPIRLTISRSVRRLDQGSRGFDGTWEDSQGLFSGQDHLGDKMLRQFY